MSIACRVDCTVYKSIHDARPYCCSPYRVTPTSSHVQLQTLFKKFLVWSSLALTLQGIRNFCPTLQLNSAITDSHSSVRSNIGLAYLLHLVRPIMKKEIFSIYTTDTRIVDAEMCRPAFGEKAIRNTRPAARERKYEKNSTSMHCCQCTFMQKIEPLECKKTGRTQYARIA